MYIYTIFIIIFIIKEYPQQAARKGTISLGCQEKMKDRKTQKSRSEEKVVSLAQPPYFPQVNGRQSLRVDAMGIDHRCGG